MPLDRDSEAPWREAWARLPLPQLAEKLGHKARPRNADPCPFCGKKGGKFNIFEGGRDGRWFFKCHNSECIANDPEGGQDEIGYLALARGLSREDAKREYLRLAVPEMLRENMPAPDLPQEPDVKPWADVESRSPWHALCKLLILTEADRAKLQNKRGFNDETINRLGFKSNNEANRDLLYALLDEFGIEKLLVEGIFKAKRNKSPEPSGQLMGWGRTGEKGKDGKEIWGVTEPILIPYFDSDGVPYNLRPHKGGVTRPVDPFAEWDTDEDDQKPCHSHLYIPPGTARLIDKNSGLCIFTEGEFKAGAGLQCRIPIIATPGTSFLKNEKFRNRVCTALDELGVTDLVIIYDNEIKDDPRFPNFKQDPFDRFDTQVWAEYAQIKLLPHLRLLKGDCRIGKIPDDERKDGKADFDGVLARYVYHEGSAKGTALARKIFLKAAEDANEPSAFRELFPSADRRIIDWKLKRRFYVPLLAIGGEKEGDLAERFNELDGDKPIDRELANAFRDTIGCYYARKSPTKEERADLDKRLSALNDRLSGVKQDTKDIRDPRFRTLFAMRDALRQRKHGMPEPLSNFTLRCDYRLHGADNKVQRLVRVVDSKDLRKKDHELVRLTGAHLCGLRAFREWILDTGDGVWKGGEKDLQNLSQDLDHQAFMRDIDEIIRIGYDKESGIWFSGDKAFGPAGEPIYPDEKGIFWHKGFGYQIDADPDTRGATGFIQDVPFFTKPHDAVALTSEEMDERGGVAGIFRALAEDLWDNIGGYDAWLGLGLTLAYAIAPELLKIGGEGHPSPWFFGKLGEGKTTTMAYLMRIWGFRQLEGIVLNDNLTDTALSRILSQYSCLPVFLDEARKETLTPTKLAIIRAAYQRQMPAKATMDYSVKVRGVPPNTSPMIGGESTSHDSATRSRFGHINVALNRRIGDSVARKNRMSQQSPHYYHIGNWLLTNRPKFVERALALLGAWQADPKVRASISQDRIRFVHGAAYACMSAASDLLGIIEEGGDAGQFDPSPESREGALPDYRPRTISQFRDFLMAYGDQAQRDVADETFVSRFWDDVQQGVARGKIPKHFFSCYRLTKKESGGYSYKPGPPFRKSSDGSIAVLMISIKHVFPAYEESYRLRTGLTAPQSMGDIFRSIKGEPYWVPPLPGRSFHRGTKVEGKTGDCWAISLEEAPGSSEEDPIYLFPGAEAFVDVITTKEDGNGR
jgi:hypothetical protein